MGITNKSKNLLKGAVFYLSGPIENDKKDGIEWRKSFRKDPKIKKMKVKILDPTGKGKGSPQENIGKEREIMRQLKADGKLAQVSKKMKMIRKYDLRCCDLADCLIVYIDKDVPTVGTWDEVITAERQQKPIFAIVKGGRRNAPDWCYRMIKYKDMFSTLEKCIDHLEKIDSGEIKMDDRWIIIKRA